MNNGLLSIMVNSNMLWIWVLLPQKSLCLASITEPGNVAMAGVLDGLTGRGLPVVEGGGEVERF